MTLSRKDVLDELVNALEPLDYVHAFWEGGAAGFDRADQWSDIDVQGIVDDDHVEDVFEVVEETLAGLSEIELKFRLPEPTWHGHSQCFYRLKDAGPFLLVDLAIMRENTEADKFDVWATHGIPQICFDKKGLVAENKLDPEAQAMLDRLRAGQARPATEAGPPVPNPIEPARPRETTGRGAERGPER